MNQFNENQSPNNAVVTHKICEFYKQLYANAGKIPKKDRFGIYLKTENVCLAIIGLLLNAAFESREKKLPFLNSARIEIELLKRLIRICQEIKIIDEDKYLEMETALQEISKMTTNWINYLRRLP